MGEPRGFTFQDVVVVRGERRALDGFSAHLPGTGVTALFLVSLKLGGYDGKAA